MAINAWLREGRGFGVAMGSLMGDCELRLRYDPCPCTPVYR